MKAVIIFNQATDITFYSVDKEFTVHLRKRSKVLDEENKDDKEDLRSALTLFFAPLITSFTVLNSIKKPLLSITPDDDKLIVFKKFGNYIFVAMNGDRSENEDVLLRKLHALHKITGLLYGPVMSKLNSPNLQQREKEWKTLNSILNTYESLYSTEQAYLMEAVENIAFGQLNAAQNVCVQLAEDCLLPFYNGGVPNVRHVLLLVGSKVLAVCGKSPQLPTADLLLLILLVNNLYEEGNVQMSTLQNGEDDSSPPEPVSPATPYQTPVQDESSSDNLTLSLPIEINVQQNQQTWKGSVEDDSFIPKGLGGRIRNMISGRKMTEKLGQPITNEEIDIPKVLEKFYVRKVFLQLNQANFIPHHIYSLEVFPQITLVLVSEFSSATLGVLICQALANLKCSLPAGNILDKYNNTRGFYEATDDFIRRIVDGSKAEARASNSEPLKHCVVKVFNTWAKCKELQFYQYLDRHLKEEIEITRVINQIECLIDNLISLYDELYLSPQVLNIDKKHVASKLMKVSSKLRQDFGDFLSVKVNINLPFSGFGMTYPGMVHFAFVDRSFDELTSPSISEGSISSSYVMERAKLKNLNPAQFLKLKMWQMVQRSQSYLTSGFTSLTWSDDDFLYTYCMWMSALNPNLGIPLRMTNPSSIKSVIDEPPGALCGSFYKEIKGGADGALTGYVNEIYCIHEPSMTLETAATQVKNLAVSLWITTKQALAPFPLIN